MTLTRHPYCRALLCQFEQLFLDLLLKAPGLNFCSAMFQVGSILWRFLSAVKNRFFQRHNRQNTLLNWLQLG